MNHFPPHDAPDLVDRLNQVSLHWRRDNGAYCRELLESILDDYPWSKEAADWYGLVMSKIRHIYSDLAMIRIHNWMAEHQVITGRPYTVDDGLDRFRVMKQVLQSWLGTHRRRRGRATVHPYSWRRTPHQWARLADIGGQMGEMGINWIGLPGARDCLVVDISTVNLKMGYGFYYDARLHWAQALGHALPIRSHCLDAVVLSGVLEHVRNPDALVAEAERSLHRGGLVLLQVPYGGMEGAPNPAADALSFRSHVRTINPLEYAEGRTVVYRGYLRYTGMVTLPHSMVGECGDWVVGYEV